MWYPTKDISLESLVIGMIENSRYSRRPWGLLIESVLFPGALEAAFWETDQLIGDDKKRYKMQGGCTVLVSVFILGKLYVANAGDSRAVLCRDKVRFSHMARVFEMVNPIDDPRYLFVSGCIPNVFRLHAHHGATATSAPRLLEAAPAWQRVHTLRLLQAAAP